MKTINESIVFDEIRYKFELDKNKANIDKATALNNVKDFLHNYNKECEMSYKYYNEFITNRSDFVIESNQIVDAVKFIQEKAHNKNIVLTVTANKIEQAVFLRSMYEYSGKKVQQIIVDEDSLFVKVNVIDLGNDMIIFHTHAEKTGDEYTRRAINNFTNIIVPNYIILLGICYGVDMKTQMIGTVNVSDKISGYRINFRDDINDSSIIVIEPEIEFEEHPDEKILRKLSRKSNVTKFKNSKHQNDFKVLFGKFLSANSLMSCAKVKNSIIQKFKIKGVEIIAGEMEACGLFKSNFYEKNDEKFDKWLVIKAVCDWGEGKNALSDDEDTGEILKDSLQAYAMLNSSEFFKYLLETDLLKNK